MKNKNFDRYSTIHCSYALFNMIRLHLLGPYTACIEIMIYVYVSHIKMFIVYTGNFTCRINETYYIYMFLYNNRVQMLVIKKNNKIKIKIE